MEAQPTQEAKSVKQKPAKDKGGNEQQDKANSIFITRELVNGPVDQIPKRLLDFKNIKNQNYQKFSERILQNLAKQDFTFSASLQIFMEISDAAAEENTTPHQMATILEGFLRYWKGCKVDFGAVKAMFANIKDIYPPISKKFISACSQLVSLLPQADFEYFQEEANKMAGKYYRGSKVEEDKFLPLVSEFDLYQTIGNDKIVQVALRYSNAGDILYIFKPNQQQVDQPLVRLYIDKSVTRDSKQDLKRCETVIRQLKLNPSSYHNMIEKMIDRYIMYQLRTYKLYFVELVVCYDRFLLEALVRQLKRERRDREAKYFVVHYGLEMGKYEDISEKERESIKKIRNILVDNDHFGPTETAVLEHENSQNYRFLELSQLNFTEKNVIFVDSSNINNIHTQTAFAGKKIGIDSQTYGGVHVFDQSKMVVLQIYSDTFFYIFDYANLQTNKKMKEIMTYIFTHCKIYGHDHPKEITNIQRELELDINESVMQELHRNRLLDTNKFFKKVFPKETRSNLVYVTEFLLKRTISKYEQCSGWNNRPLRKAQMHYACLDCLLPLILGQKMEQVQRSKQKK